jgi:hypothetical protein
LGPQDIGPFKAVSASSSGTAIVSAAAASCAALAAGEGRLVEIHPPVSRIVAIMQ